MRGEMIDGVWVPGWKLRYWVLMDRARYGIAKRKEAFWRTAARRLPRELRKWSLVHATAQAMGLHKSPDQVRYEDQYKAIEPRPGR